MNHEYAIPSYAYPTTMISPRTISRQFGTKHEYAIPSYAYPAAMISPRMISRQFGTKRNSFLHFAVFTFNGTRIATWCRALWGLWSGRTASRSWLAVDVLAYALHSALQVIRGGANS